MAKRRKAQNFPAKKKKLLRLRPPKRTRIATNGNNSDSRDVEPKHAGPSTTFRTAGAIQGEISEEVERLLQRRDLIAYRLEEHWHDLEWGLRRLRNPGKKQTIEDVRKAFEPLREHDREDLFGLLYRATSIQATRIQVRKTWGARVEPDSRLSTLQTQLEAQRLQCDAKRRAVYQASEENLEQMEREIVYRRSNVLKLQEEYRISENALSKANEPMLTGDSASAASAKAKLFKFQTDYETWKALLATETRIVEDLQKRIDNANPQTRVWTKEAAEKEETELARLEELGQDLRAELAQLEDRYEDQAASYSRQDFLSFLSKRRCRHNPRAVAMAIAGLPGRTCRDCYALCHGYPFRGDPHPNYERCQVFVQAWNLRDKTSTDPEARTQLFLNEIRKIPKMRLYQGERVRNHLWEFFNANQNEIELAIRSQLRENAELERVPHLIFSRVLKMIRGKIAAEAGMSDLDRVIAERRKTGNG